MPRILIVDDNPDFGPLLEAFLAKAGHEARFAHDGKEALERAAEADLVLLDLHLPLLDGAEVFKRLQADPKTAKLPVIFMSGAGAADDAPAGPKVRRLKKPFDPNQMVTMIRELLNP
jgi:two-component system alkaline phosphatase synthesis response regulator PhoP